ncbi:MAG: PLDc N-terminal domain-containing protein [Desulfovibrio sp.]|nr:PLDc N-terminal domain-containing protein [Desulfovibrio sp.]
MQFFWWYVLLAVLPLPNLWSIWHIWRHEFASFQQKASWLCVAVFIPVLGGLLYLALGRPKAGALVNSLGRPKEQD